MADALVNHPYVGSVWLWGAKIVETDRGPYVEGETWDDSEAGSPYMPEGYTGQPVTMNFPATCIRKWCER